MKLPGGSDAYIPARKLVDYLLNLSHPVGASKARLLRSIGFDETNTDLLGRALLAVAHSEEVVEVEETAHGVKYVVEGIVHGSTGPGVRLRTVWIIEPTDPRPRLVTAYPP